ncbi:TetR/AcrR family transcriptional regulator [Paenibacillus sp. FSL R5-0527]|uniref:TetR/AcrR family transcriptional regulator n=1 Tax=Paenibacillus sp. FSL R5-0527 TaxID=2975321 RepID=UPI0040477EE7
MSKGTLYRHFPSKDDLIIAYLEEKNESAWIQFDDAISAYDGSPRMQILAFPTCTRHESSMEPPSSGYSIRFVCCTRFP